MPSRKAGKPKLATSSCSMRTWVTDHAAKACASNNQTTFPTGCNQSPAPNVVAADQVVAVDELYGASVSPRTRTPNAPMPAEMSGETAARGKKRISA